MSFPLGESRRATGGVLQERGKWFTTAAKVAKSWRILARDSSLLLVKHKKTSTHLTLPPIKHRFGISMLRACSRAISNSCRCFATIRFIRAVLGPSSPSPEEVIACDSSGILSSLVTTMTTGATKDTRIHQEGKPSPCKGTRLHWWCKGNLGTEVERSTDWARKRSVD